MIPLDTFTGLSSPQFWIAVLQIILIDILLSGDNAVVIALACRNLPPRQRRLGIFWGVSGAIILRVTLTFFAVSLLAIPYLKIVGAALLLWIGVKLIQPQDGEGHEIRAAGNLFGAVRTIIIADFVMSLDNVIAVAAAAHDSLFLLIFGLALSIPLMVWASQLILRLMDRIPSIVVVGGALLGWVGLSMAVHDPVVKDWAMAQAAWLNWVAPAAGAALVVAVGKLLSPRVELGRARPEGVADLAERDRPAPPQS
ncbi:MAG TPA: TerC family protein [Burkholderiales bacterium]|jgi:YjbE family integral membrane protein|nr:TerC family protein [Burkholderiales bacterium]